MTANQIKAAELFERKRSNLVNESIGRDTLTETGRHNRFTESETLRHNQATELNAMDTLREMSRHNVAGEGIDWSRVAEMQRHNLAGEGIDSSRVAETNRHNRHSEAQGYIKNATDAIGTVGKVVSMFVGK